MPEDVELILGIRSPSEPPPLPPGVGWQPTGAPPPVTPDAPAPKASGMSKWMIALIGCGSVALAALVAGGMLTREADLKQRVQRIQCLNNLKQIGLAFRVWAEDNEGQYPFNVSTKDGGTREFCLRGADGFDGDSCRHFQVMSNELFTVKILVCPADTVRQVPGGLGDFSRLQAVNVSYQIHSGTNVTESNPLEVLAVCPIHHNVLRADGSVETMSEEAFRRLTSEFGRQP